MKLFLKKTTTFLILVGISILSVSILLNIYLNKKAHFSLDKNITSVVFGHSQPQTAFNDSLIANFKNIAEPGEPYLFTYIKAKQILKNNPQIKKVFIEYSNVDISLVKDNDIWSDKHINLRYPIFSELMDWQERNLLFHKNPKAVIQVLSKTLKRQFSRIVKNNYNYLPAMGGYNHLDESKLDSILKGNIKKNNANYYLPSKYNLLYLDKILSLCKDKHLAVYLIKSPMYTDSYYLDNDNLLYKIKNEKYSDIEFLDFTKFPLSNKEFRDLNHLNHKGAKKFSLWFNKLLKDGLLKKQDKQEIINKSF
ncbi:hypothetical protein [Lacinutrix sp. MEBiC02595]